MNSTTINFRLGELIGAALAEDLGHGDITTQALVDTRLRCHAQVWAKDDGVVSGINVFRHVFDRLESDITDWTALHDGEAYEAGMVVAAFEGRAQTVLMGERVALNLLQRLSGIAGLTAEYVKAAEGHGAAICDTRKTTPLWRSLEKQAVVHGGGRNHRFGLYDGVLIKENHIEACGGIGTAVRRAQENTHHLTRIQVEVQSLEDLGEAVAAGADAALLDHMDNDTLAEAVKQGKAAGIILEASGNMTLGRIPSVVATGVDIISVGALTHSAPAADFSMIIQTV